MATSRTLVPSTSRQLRRCLHVSATSRAQSDAPSVAQTEKEENSMEALKRLGRMPFYMRPSSIMSRDLALGNYYALRDTKSASLWDKFAYWATDRWLLWSSRNQIGSALGLRWPATWTGGTVTQSLREDAANAYVRLNSAFGKNALWHPGPKSFASEGLLKEFAARRDELQHWNLSWECQETTDDLIGKSSLFNSKHLKIMGYRLGAAPDVNGEIAQVAQALVRYNTTQRLHAGPKKPQHPSQNETLSIALDASPVTEYFIFQRYIGSPDSTWKMVKRVFPEQYAPQKSNKEVAEELAAIDAPVANSS